MIGIQAFFIFIVGFTEELLHEHRVGDKIFWICCQVLNSRAILKCLGRVGSVMLLPCGDLLLVQQGDIADIAVSGNAKRC